MLTFHCGTHYKGNGTLTKVPAHMELTGQGVTGITGTATHLITAITANITNFPPPNQHIKQ